MQAIDLRNFLYLHRYQVIVAVLLLCGSLNAEAQRQRGVAVNLPNYTEKFLHYGFGMGLHTSRYTLQYSDAFATPDLDSLHSIVPEGMGGFKIGFISNFRLFQYLDFRPLITIGFYENKLLYRSVTGNTLEELLDATLIEVPLLFKYRSVRRDNVAMYLVGGVTPTLEARGKDDKADSRERLQTRSSMIALEAGVGFDLYYPLFKFSPEIRYSWGITNLLTDETNKFNAGLKRLTPHNISFYITFEGGPS